MFNNCRPFPSIASDSEMKVFSATIPNTLKPKRRKTSSHANVNNSWQQLLFICITANTLNKNRRCARTWHSLCANAVWCVLETRTLEEWRRPSRASASGGWRGDTACWNSMPKWVREAKCAEDIVSSADPDPPDTDPNPTGSHATNTPAVDKSWFSKKNLSGDEYQRCQGVPGAAGDTPTLWGEETYARSALMQLF